EVIRRVFLGQAGAARSGSNRRSDSVGRRDSADAVDPGAMPADDVRAAAMRETAPVRAEVRTVTNVARALDASDEAGAAADATDAANVAAAANAHSDVRAAATAAGKAATEATRFS